MRYEIGKLDLSALLVPCCRAGEALARLDERVLRSTIRAGFLERQDFHDAAASLWVDGELVHVEDLVLHDARMDVRTPTHELTIAHSVLRARRQIFDQPPLWALSAPGLARLRGRGQETAAAQLPAAPGHAAPLGAGEPPDEAADAGEGMDFSEIDALIARSSAILEGVGPAPERKAAPERDPLVYDADWDEEERLSEWRLVLQDTAGLPAILRAALLLDAWNSLQVLQHIPWLGRQLVSAFLRQEGPAASHLVAVNAGLRAVPRERRHARDRLSRLMAILEAFENGATQGLKTHDRLVLARLQLERRLVKKRANSRLPQLVDLVIARPVVSAGIIARELGVTIQGALGLASELQLREITGRERFRAWSIL
ncbi:RHE_PE00001 family protein [Rhizobium sp. TRM96647]|uniref:RHE_PE00001 family protein n=1 Tax=unclassified Rhizobium TaxID=2613769 RepID=UPI0021E70F41|nr:MULTISPECIES: RHE_PE00001 family protein [unclassified Rhizobium]MCV3739043.1 RHE_PE00001 family protein [Rhizobium sp. TRM96647]MCV3760558.1 RHE_PE00001 family protein [Rhizobium sp. TRM96650]